MEILGGNGLTNSNSIDIICVKREGGVYGLKYPKKIVNLRWAGGIFKPTGEHFDVLLHMVAEQYGFKNAYEMIIDNEQSHKWVIYDKELASENRKIERDL